MESWESVSNGTEMEMYAHHPPCPLEFVPTDSLSFFWISISNFLSYFANLFEFVQIALILRFNFSAQRLREATRFNYFPNRLPTPKRWECCQSQAREPKQIPNKIPKDNTQKYFEPKPNLLGDYL